MSTGETLIYVDGISKKFCRDLRTSLRYGVHDLWSEILGRRHSMDLRPQEFWAVKDISFELKRGEALGLLGRNGAGKTTLLRMLNGLIKPDRGRIVMHGRVGGLIALGAGFNPVLTGRENVYNNGAVLGWSKSDIDRRFDDIVDFAELKDFIDMPLQTYSSGMNVRLGFAVATAFEPDILILDEVLAVGDASFRSKCYGRISQIRENAAVIFVTHSMDQVARICDHTLVLGKNIPSKVHPVSEGIRLYEDLTKSTGKEDRSFVAKYGGIQSFEVLTNSTQVKHGDCLRIRLKVRSSVRYEKVRVRLAFFDMSDSAVADCVLRDADMIDLSVGECVYSLMIQSITLKNGDYKFNVAMMDESGNHLAWSYKNNHFHVVDASFDSTTPCQLLLKVNGSEHRLTENDIADHASK